MSAADRPHPDTAPAASTSQTVPSPGAGIEVRRVDATGYGPGAVLVTVTGDGRHDAAILSRAPHHAFDDGVPVVVVDLGAAGRCDPAALEVLACARDRARSAGIGLHLLDRGQPVIGHQLAAAGLI